MNKIIKENLEREAELIEEDAMRHYKELSEECKDYNEFFKKSDLDSKTASSIWMDKCLKIN